MSGSTGSIKKRKTATSDFGVGGREGHDSSGFYEGRMYAGLQRGKRQAAPAAPVPLEAIDRIFCHSSERMAELPDNSVHLMVTSPPYNAGKAYSDHNDNLSLDDYRAMLRRIWAETYRVLCDGGRAAINIANVGRCPYLPLATFITEDMLGLGFQMRGEIIWDKGASAGGSTAWGSWRSAANPTLRDQHEYILVFSKGAFGRSGKGRENTLTKEMFLEYTRSVWQFPTVSAKKIGHPAPFPVELPLRLIHLYTFVGDMVLDPFMGSGQTAIAAVSAGRHFVGYDLSSEYVALAEGRVRAAARPVSNEELEKPA